MSGGHDSGGNMRWLLTYADMITLLLAFFVIMYAISKVDLKKYQTIAASIRGAFRTTPNTTVPTGGGEHLLPAPDPLGAIVAELQAQLAEEIRDGRIQVERGPDRIVLRFQDTVFFERGRTELQPRAQHILDKLALVVGRLPNALEAEGHTDTLPIRSLQFPSNWELAVARATAVVRYLVEAHGISPLRLSARGLGEHKPLYPNDPRTGEPRNRRVEIRILAGTDAQRVPLT